MVPIRTARPGRRDRQLLGRHARPTDQELDLLQALADSTAVAIENVQVYEQLDAARTETLQCLAPRRRVPRRRDLRAHRARRRPRRADRRRAGLGRRRGRASCASPLPCTTSASSPSRTPCCSRPASSPTTSSSRSRCTPRPGRRSSLDAQSDVLRMGREVARAHHEWWDGSGYPYGLSGSAIPERRPDRRARRRVRRLDLRRARTRKRGRTSGPARSSRVCAAASSTPTWSTPSCASPDPGQDRTKGPAGQAGPLISSHLQAGVVGRASAVRGGRRCGSLNDWEGERGGPEVFGLEVCSDNGNSSTPAEAIRGWRLASAGAAGVAPKGGKTAPRTRTPVGSVLRDMRGRRRWKPPPW